MCVRTRVLEYWYGIHVLQYSSTRVHVYVHVYYTCTVCHIHISGDMSIHVYTRVLQYIIAIRSMLLSPYRYSSYWSKN